MSNNDTSDIFAIIDITTKGKNHTINSYKSDMNLTNINDLNEFVQPESKLPNKLFVDGKYCVYCRLIKKRTRIHAKITGFKKITGEI